MISLNHVTFTYTGTETPAIKDISFTIPDGQFLAIIGENGSGKSTLSLVLTGFIPHFYNGKLDGEVFIQGQNTQKTLLDNLVLNVGLVHQNPFNQISGSKFTVREEIAFGLENIGIPREEMIVRIENVMDKLRITHLADRLPFSLSGGQMQRVVIASVMAMRPQILVLDEPTSQIDPIGSREVFEAIKVLSQEEKITVVITEHKLELITLFADRLLALSRGEIIADGIPTDVLAQDIIQSIDQTRYTQAARLIRNLGYGPNGRKLPVTLSESIESFESILHT